MNLQLKHRLTKVCDEYERVPDVKLVKRLGLTSGFLKFLLTPFDLQLKQEGDEKTKPRDPPSIHSKSRDAFEFHSDGIQLITT